MGRRKRDRLDIARHPSPASGRAGDGAQRGRSQAHHERWFPDDAPSLTPDEVQAWLGVLNDTRLVLGTRLGVTEEEHVLDPADPDAGAYALYQWLTWVQGDLVEELL